MKKYKSIIFLIIFLQFILAGNFDVSGQIKGHKHYIDISTAKELREIFRFTGDSVSFLSAHRGGPENNFPENCIETFANTLDYTYCLMEIDPRYTKDSVIILHHDPTLERTTTGQGRVSDYTLKELKKLWLKDIEGNVTRYRIPTIEEALKWAKGKTILVLDRKDVPVEGRVKMIEACRAEAYTVIMAYTFEEAKICYRMNNNIMMQIFINSPEKVREFDQTGVPWENVVAFVGHSIPDNPEVFQLIHKKGALCILGTSRNLDQEFINGESTNIEKTKNGYNSLYREGADILETDIPVIVSKVVAGRLSSEMFKSKFLK